MDIIKNIQTTMECSSQKWNRIFHRGKWLVTYRNGATKIVTDINKETDYLSAEKIK